MNILKKSVFLAFIFGSLMTIFEYRSGGEELFSYFIYCTISCFVLMVIAEWIYDKVKKR